MNTPNNHLSGSSIQSNAHTPTQKWVAFVSVQRINKKDTLLITAAAHNLREIKYRPGRGPAIDSSKSKDNEILEGPSTAKGVDELSKQLLLAAGTKKLRRDAVIAIEALFSLPPTMPVNEIEYFKDCIKWVKKYFPVPLLSAVIHRDESVAHCHALLLPLLIDGTMNGSKLFGPSKKLEKLQSDFYENVGKHYGMQKNTKKKRRPKKERDEISDKAIETIRQNPAVLDDKQFSLALKKSLSANPDPLLQVIDFTETYPV